jgi:hypothetical protein
VTKIPNKRIGRGLSHLGFARLGFAGFGLAVGLCAIAVLGAGSRSASAQDPSKASLNTSSEESAAPAAKSRNGGRYFVDFRSRTAASYGHAFLWYGRLKENGKVGMIEVAGLHPATDSVVPYIL